MDKDLQHAFMLAGLDINVDEPTASQWDEITKLYDIIKGHDEMVFDIDPEEHMNEYLKNGVWDGD